jgi:Protein of unknown function (DUF2934)
VAKKTKEVAMIQHKEPSREEITRLAYGLYLQRGAEPGKDVEDWVEAEKELSKEFIVGGSIDLR